MASSWVGGQSQEAQVAHLVTQSTPLGSWKRCQVPEEKPTLSSLFISSLTSGLEHEIRGEGVVVREQGRC